MDHVCLVFVMTFFVKGQEVESKETKEWKEFLKEKEQQTKQKTQGQKRVKIKPIFISMKTVKNNLMTRIKFIYT